jgi:hypothetical protein
MIRQEIMKLRTLIGIIFIAASLVKLASIWGLIQPDWVESVSQQSWTVYFAPLLLIYIGVVQIIESFKEDRDQWLRRPLPIGEDGKRIYCAVSYGADEYIFRGEPFHGAHLRAFCGGLRMDLRNAVITEDEEIDIHTFLGGVVLYVPTSVNVVVRSRSFIGGVGNETDRNVKPDAPCLHIVARNLCGGVSVRVN